MKSKVRWGNKAFSVGMIVFLMSFIIGCGSGGWGDPSPVGVAPFNTSCLPLTVTNSDGGYGSFTFDADGNLLFVVNDEDEIRLLNRNTCTVTTVATEVSGVFRLGE